MGFLYSDEKIAQMKAEWAADHPEPPKPPTHAERLCELARANPNAKVKDLAFAAERSTGWVRKILRQNNITLVKPPKKPRLRIKASTLCHACGHPKGGRRALSQREQSHCLGHVRHLHWSNPNSYVCTTRHCLSFNYDDNGQPVACECPDFVVPQPEQTEKGE